MLARRSHGALCAFTAHTVEQGLGRILSGEGTYSDRTRIQITVKSTFSETKLVPALNDVLIAHPTPASVSRFRMGWLVPYNKDPLDSIAYNSAPVRDGSSATFPSSISSTPPPPTYEAGTITRFNNETYQIKRSFNAWSSGMWVCTPTGSTAAMAAAGGRVMNPKSPQLQYLIREHVSGGRGDMGGGESIRVRLVR